MMRQRWLSTVLVAVLLMLAVVSGCAPVKVRQTTLQSTYTTTVQADVISTGELSQLTQQVLRLLPKGGDLPRRDGSLAVRRRR